jgi:hypothetical protein
MASVAATQALVQQAQTGAASAQTAQVALYAASEGARQSVTGFMHDYYDRHVFDRYLKFTSAEDEEEYRKREQQYRQSIDEARAEHTPEGDLRAANLSLEQLHDAGKHGATASPDYSRWDKNLTDKRDALAQAIAGKNATQRISAPSADPLASVQADAGVSLEVLASLRAAGVSVAEQEVQGHGISVGQAKSGDRSR